MFIFSLYFATKFLQANRAERDQTPRSAASELGLLCLHISPKWISGLAVVTKALSAQIRNKNSFHGNINYYPCTSTAPDSTIVLVRAVLSQENVYG